MNNPVYEGNPFVVVALQGLACTVLVMLVRRMEYWRISTLLYTRHSFVYKSVYVLHLLFSAAYSSLVVHLLDCNNFLYLETISQVLLHTRHTNLQPSCLPMCNLFVKA